MLSNVIITFIRVTLFNSLNYISWFTLLLISIFQVSLGNRLRYGKPVTFSIKVLYLLYEIEWEVAFPIECSESFIIFLF